MSAKELFGVVLRLIGLVLCLLSLWYFIYVPVVLFGPEVPGGPPFYQYLISGMICLVIGLYFLRGAPHVARFSYPEPHKKSDE